MYDVILRVFNVLDWTCALYYDPD